MLYTKLSDDLVCTCADADKMIVKRDRFWRKADRTLKKKKERNMKNNKK